MKDRIHMLKNSPWFPIVAFAFVLNCIIELLGRSNPLELIVHMVTQPGFFLYNVLILSTTLCLSLFFKRKNLVRLVISALWLAVGIANYVVLSYRITPFSAIDLFIMEWDISFVKVYASVPMVIGAVLVLGGAIYLSVRLFRMDAPTPRQFKRGGISMGVLVLCVVGLYTAFLQLDIYEDRITNMQMAYDQFGVVTCFTRSAIERGIEAPEDYSEVLVSHIVDDLPEEEEVLAVSPNLIVIQLESFFDPSQLLDTTFSENPVPTYTQISADYSSGGLYVPVVGAGTANTEFEVVTGMDVDFFGTGEYPYESVLQTSTCESVAYALKELGYYTTAMHNNTATFYERQQVYPNLGFDTFISSEFMTNLTTTPQGWVKDECLTSEMFLTMETTDAADFIFAVSVQGHGPFPEEEDESLPIQVTSSPFDEALENQLEYYVNQLYEMDCFVADLLAQCEEFDQPTVVVLYGDHLPSLPFDADMLSTGDNYQTSYVIWSNYDLEEVDQNLSTYQLLAQALDQMDIHSGTLTLFHQTCAQDADYLEQLEILQYDMLYGEAYYSEEAILKPTEMTMGIVDITITDCHQEGEYLLITGENFTASSVIFVENKELETTLTEDGALQVALTHVAEGDTLTVHQLSPNGTDLYQSQGYPYLGQGEAVLPYEMT